MRSPLCLALSATLLATWSCYGQVPATRPATAASSARKLAFIEVDIPHKRVAVECTAVNAEAAMEFFCVAENGPDHETVLKTSAKPSDIHLALLMIGLTPGEPVKYSEAADKWFPPQGPPLRISAAFEKEGRKVVLPASQLLRDRSSKKSMPVRTWVFTGSRIQTGGQYAADLTGYVVSVVNFDLTPIDIPEIASSSNELLEWELNENLAPPRGAKVSMIIEPAGQPTIPAAPAATQPTTGQVVLDRVKLDRLRDQWQANVASKAQTVQQAATQHYQIMQELRAEQNRLVDEADRVARLIEELERDYHELTTPRPATAPAK